MGVYCAHASVWANSILFNQCVSYLLVEEHQLLPRYLKLHNAFYHEGRNMWYFEGRLGSYDPFLFVSLLFLSSTLNYILAIKKINFVLLFYDISYLTMMFWFISLIVSYIRFKYIFYFILDYIILIFNLFKIGPCFLDFYFCFGFFC